MKNKFDDFSVRLVLKSDQLTERFELWLKALWAKQRGFADSGSVTMFEQGLRLAFVLTLFLIAMALI